MHLSLSPKQFFPEEPLSIFVVSLNTSNTFFRVPFSTVLRRDFRVDEF